MLARGGYLYDGWDLDMRDNTGDGRVDRDDPVEHRSTDGSHFDRTYNRFWVRRGTYPGGWPWKSGRVDISRSWEADGEPGNFEWWGGKDWHGGGGNPRWDWFGDDAATFYDKPCFNRRLSVELPAVLGWVGKAGCFQFRTYIADKATQTVASMLPWGFQIDYTAPRSGTHTDKC